MDGNQKTIFESILGKIQLLTLLLKRKRLWENPIFRELARVLKQKEIWGSMYILHLISYYAIKYLLYSNNYSFIICDFAYQFERSVLCMVICKVYLHYLFHLSYDVLFDLLLNVRFLLDKVVAIFRDV